MGQCAPLQTAQEMQQQDTARAIVDAFAGHAPSRQRPQFGEDYHRVAHAHAERLHLSRAVNSQINVQVGQGEALPVLRAGSQMPRTRSNHPRSPGHPHRTPFQQARLRATNGHQPQKSLGFDARYYRPDLISMGRDHDVPGAWWPLAVRLPM
jgi:hypothetical protein